ncbi:unnamed protein product [Larinioides sclopetarius]|uniref:Ig-like domain-containing protein n=1 Tax=Larinioides sclopetarius TaxID=280406 RepID=A0AAV2BL51_9ARAC
MKSPDIVWKIGGKLLKNNSRFVFGEYTILDLYQNNLIECNVGPELVSPEIVKHPLNITVDEGETARFHCVFNYSDAAPVFWLKDTIVLEDLRNEIISNDHNSSLTVHNVAPSDAGSYQCQIVPEKIPIVLSKTALLVVRDANNTEQAASSSDKICKGCSEVSTPRSTSNLDSKMIYLLSGAAMLILLIIAVFFWCKRLKIKSFNLWKANHEDLELKNV